jgi:HD-GYP domain-containing protein (c-di-GMP phosphodiesterase class II)
LRNAPRPFVARARPKKCAATLFRLNRHAARDDSNDVTPRPQHLATESVRVSEILAALSFALDLTEGQPMGHSLRACLIGMEIAHRLGLPMQQRRDLYYALMLKDVGCSSNSARVFELFGGDDREAKRALKRVDWANYFKAARYAIAQAEPGAPWFVRARRIAGLARRGSGVAEELVRTRCDRGASIVSRLGFGTNVAEAVRNLDEHWDGGGQPRGLSGSEIPLLSRILGVAQTMAVFAVVDGPEGASQVIEARRGRWFDPTLVVAARGMEPQLARWIAMDEGLLGREAGECEPGGAALLAGSGTLDRIALGFAEVVDAKSPFTAQHSYRVTQLAVRLAESMDYTPEAITRLRRAALLHDIGKLSVSNTNLDKPGKLIEAEWDAVRMHPYYTQRILQHIRGFEEIAYVAGCHHERLDGKGYFMGLEAEQIPQDAQIISAADIFDALSSERPYRPALEVEVALGIMENDRDRAVPGDLLDTLSEIVRDAPGGEVQRRAA